MSAALIRGNRREEERKEVDVGSQEGEGLLIENPKTPRGPRSPDFVRISPEKETPIGSLLPDFEFLCFFFFRFGLLWAEMDFGL